MTRPFLSAKGVACETNIKVLNFCSEWGYNGTSLKGHLWNKDIWLIRTLDRVPTFYRHILFSPQNMHTSLIRAIILVPRVSVLEGFHCRCSCMLTVYVEKYYHIFSWQSQIETECYQWTSVKGQVHTCFIWHMNICYICRVHMSPALNRGIYSGIAVQAQWFAQNRQ